MKIPIKNLNEIGVYSIEYYTYLYCSNDDCDDEEDYIRVYARYDNDNDDDIELGRYDEKNYLCEWQNRSVEIEITDMNINVKYKYFII
jgi:hypothetical protein